MEEMVSTEALENEILDDARKKGERLLREAEAEAKRIGLESEAKTAEALELLAADFRSRAERYSAENRARLPLEKGRMKASYIDALLKEACAAYLASFSHVRLASTVAALLSRGSGLVGEREIAVSYRGLSEKEARAICSQALPGARLASLMEDGKLPAPGVLVAAGEGSLSIRATLDLVGERLLDEKRGELAAVLCAEALAL